jgi:hypothetical protein
MVWRARWWEIQSLPQFLRLTLALDIPHVLECSRLLTNNKIEGVVDLKQTLVGLGVPSGAGVLVGCAEFGKL